MHKQIVNELRLAYAIEPRGPILIKSGKEAGADPTLLDMNFVRLDHAALGRATVYLPGSSLKGTVRSYCEKIARTVGADCCDPLSQNACDKRPEKEIRRRKEENRQRPSGERLSETLTTAETYGLLCTACRMFGHTVMAAHVRFSDAYPLNPVDPDDLTAFDAANATEQRDGVAIDRISGAVAVGPFNLEVVTKGTFFGDLVIRNFQLWQIGLLAIALRDIARERVPIGFSKSRGLGRVNVRYRELEVAYPGRFHPGGDGRDLAHQLYGVTGFLDRQTARAYDYRPEPILPLPAGGELAEDGSYGRVAVAFREAEAIERVLAACVEPWRAFVEERQGRGGG